jgi:hypothetical protein
MAYPKTLKGVGITTQTCPSPVAGRCMDPHNSNLEAISFIYNLRVHHAMWTTDQLTMHEMQKTHVWQQNIPSQTLLHTVKFILLEIKYTRMQAKIIM